MANAIFALTLTITLFVARTASSVRRPSPASCTDELVAFSPCLGYVSSPPNNITDTATSQCCGVFAKAFDSSDGNCFCYLIKQPLIFGFPLNQSRLLSLPSVCSSLNASSTAAMMNQGSLDSVCSGPDNAMPPFTNLPTQSAETSPTPSGLPPESVVKPWTHPMSSTTPARRSSATKHISSSSSNWTLLGVLTSLVICIHL